MTAIQYLLVIPITRLTDSPYGPAMRLPLHCTVMPWFTPSQSLAFPDLDREISSIARRAPEQDLVSEAPELFGPEKNIPVHVLAENRALRRMHDLFLAFLTGEGCAPTDSLAIGKNYRPHVTDSHGQSFPPGAKHHARCVVLLEKKADGNRVVTTRYRLAH
jgi:hypothetical protein